MNRFLFAMRRRESGVLLAVVALCAISPACFGQAPAKKPARRPVRPTPASIDLGAEMFTSAPPADAAPASRDDALKKIEGALSKQAAMNSELTKTGVATGAEDVYASTLAAVRSLGAATSGTEAVKARIIAASLEHLKPSSLSFRDAANRVEGSRALHPAGLLSREAVEKRISLYRDMQRANVAVVEAYQSLPAAIERLFAAELRLPPDEQEAYREWLTATMEPERVIRARQHTALACELAFTALGILRDEWGRWRMNGAGDGLDFLPDFPAEKHPVYNKAVEDYQTVMERLRALEK